MKRNLQYSVMISILAIGMLGTTAAWAANTGGKVVQNGMTWAYAGTKAQGSNVHVDSALDSKVTEIIGGLSVQGNVSSNTLTIAGGKFSKVDMITGGATMKGSANGNTVNITGGNIVMGDYDFITGGLGVTSATNNKVNISGGTIEGFIYGGRTQSDGTVSGNTITISGSADLSKAALSGGYSMPDPMIMSRRINNKTAVNNNNKLVIDGWSGSVLQAENFDSIDFKNIQWKNGGTVLKLTDSGYESLKDTNINLVSLAGGTKPAINQSMYIIQGEDLGIDENKVTVSKEFSAGVALVGTGEAKVVDDGLKYTINSLMLNSQTHLVAQNHAVAAAFVNQGTDLISDSLDTLSRDHKYGVKTFAAVHGNHSKYDVNSDLKINGWSGIVGVGNEKDIGNGDFSWGAFFENGSGTYRTYNSFNGDFFRGDGNVVYNGGGVAARFEQDNGVYTEGSLRAGLLKNEMKDALRDGAGNSYGYKSESTYYGAHIGVGKIISLDADKDLDIYGKFFHTYTEGDTFTVAGDKFDLDGITSDRLRIGARLTTNKENKFSTYYGLAYEYEFNGDADMRVENMSTPQQSLKGSSYMAEVGVNYQPSSDSPWSFDLSMRGYAGQREGFSGNVQAVYSF